MYTHIIRPILFLFSPEKAHRITMKLIHILGNDPLIRQVFKACFSIKTPTLERELFGIKFKNPVGIAAGLDKDAQYYNDLATLSPSFIEIGSLTDKPQSGNPQPRCFRLPDDKAIINRMGINNLGVRNAIHNIQSNPPKGIVLAGSITKNSTTPNTEAAADIERTYSMICDFVDMVVINVSCPNVEGLSGLQDISFLSGIIENLVTVRRFNDGFRPILIKLSPDIPDEQVSEIVRSSLLAGVDGFVVANTTHDRSGLKTDERVIEKIGNGGLSGAPLFERTLELVKTVHKQTEDIVPIIAVGGIMTPQQAQEMLDAGASLIEIYTGLIYNGPAFIKKILKYLVKVDAQRHPEAKDKKKEKAVTQ